MSEIIPLSSSSELVPEIDEIEIAGQIADEAARQTAVYRYIEKRALETTRRQRADLRLFERYLADIGVPLKVALDVYAWKKLDIEHRGEMVFDLTPWSRLSTGLVEGFIPWQVAQNYDVHSINVHFTTVKMYCKIAARSGVLDKNVYQEIALIESYRGREAVNLDTSRNKKRVGLKKSEAIILTLEQITLLKQQPATPQGYRDAVIVNLFLDHGLRCGELAALTRQHIDLDKGTMIFYREKVDRTQTHDLSRGSLLALGHYLSVVDLAPEEQLLRGSQKGNAGQRIMGGMSKRAITARVNTLGKRIGIPNLSAHDGRDTWATHAAKSGTSMDDLADAGGWSNIYTPYNKYVKPNSIANKGIKLGY